MAIRDSNRKPTRRERVATGEKIRVLVVDDSAFFRIRISHVLEQTGKIEVIGQAADGGEAVTLAERLKPDLITMDVEMPVLDGISAVRQIMRRAPTDIVMFSAQTREGARATLDALEAGAVDFIPKQTRSTSDGGAESSGELLRERVIALCSRRDSGPRSDNVPPPRLAPRPVESSSQRVALARVQLVVIGASTGGPVALQRILTALPANFPIPVLVAVHMPATFTSTFAERLDQLCNIGVAEARNLSELLPGRALVAPGGRQTLISGRAGALRVTLKDREEELYKPSVDICFGSAARVVGAGVLAVVLTGMGADGSQGAKFLQAQGATVWSQDAASCAVYGMPQAVERAGLSDRVLALDAIGPALATVV